jgi:hypothetical protein
MLTQLKVNIRSFLKLLLPNQDPKDSTGASHLEPEPLEGDEISKENEIFSQRIAPYSCNLSQTTFNSLLLLLNVSVSETLSTDIFHALQDQYVDPLTTQLFQSFLFEDQDHLRAQQLHYIDMLWSLVDRRSNAETCNPSQWQYYFDCKRRLEVLTESIQKVDAVTPVTSENDQSFSSISSTSIVSCKILSGSTTPSNSRSSSAGSSSVSNESTTNISPPNLNHYRKLPLTTNRKLGQLDDTLGHRIGHVELPKIQEEMKGSHANHHEKKKSPNASLLYFDDLSDSDDSRQCNSRVRTPKSQADHRSRDSLKFAKTDPQSNHLGDGNERSLEMSDGYDSGDYNRDLVAQRQRSMRGNVRVRRSKTTEDADHAYESLVFCDEEHISSNRRDIQSVLGDPNDI